MSLSPNVTKNYTAILREELVPAMGCTEPIAIAYAAAILRHALGADPAALKVELSGNIIKNVKSVIVPATDGMHGIEAAVAAGIVAGCPDRRLEVLCALKPADTPRIRDFLAAVPPVVCELAMALHSSAPRSVAVALHSSESTASQWQGTEQLRVAPICYGVARR